MGRSLIIYACLIIPLSYKAKSFSQFIPEAETL
jgi:hypothetical protein